MVMNAARYFWKHIPTKTEIRWWWNQYFLKSSDVFNPKHSKWELKTVERICPLFTRPWMSSFSFAAKTNTEMGFSALCHIYRQDRALGSRREGMTCSIDDRWQMYTCKTWFVFNNYLYLAWISPGLSGLWASPSLLHGAEGCPSVWDSGCQLHPTIHRDTRDKRRSKIIRPGDDQHTHSNTHKHTQTRDTLRTIPVS